MRTIRAGIVASLVALAAGPGAARAQDESPPGAGAAPADAEPAEKVEPQEPAEPGAAKPETPAAPEKPAAGPRLADLLGVPAEGFFTFRYRGRRTHHDQDQDLQGLLGLDLGDRRRTAVSGHFLASLDWDVDGGQDNVGYTPYDSLADTYASPVHGRVYDAYLELHRIPAVRSLRLGRQHLSDTPVLAAVDGARLETGECPLGRVRAGLYSGWAARLYTSPLESEPLYGAFAELRPGGGFRVRADWMHVPDADGVADGLDDVLGFAGWWTSGDWLQLHARHTRLEGQARDVRADAAISPRGWGLRVQGSYGELFRTQREAPLENDLFVSTLVERIPYREARLLASQELGEHLTLEAGADARRLTDEDDEGPYNREFSRGRASGTVRDLPARGLSASVEWEVWESQGRRFWTLGGEIGWRLDAGLDLRAGTDYALYTYDILGERERDHVRIWYVRARWKATRWLRLSVDYEWEDDQFEVTQTVKAGATWRF